MEGCNDFTVTLQCYSCLITDQDNIESTVLVLHNIYSAV